MVLILIPVAISLIFRASALEAAASSGQIRVALENKYDDTGPGAKQPEPAYKTYRNLENVILGYLDDPDTKLPDYEKARAIHLLSQLNRIQLYDETYNYQKQPLAIKSLLDRPKASVLLQGIQKDNDRRYYSKQIVNPQRPFQPNNYFHQPALENKIYSVDGKPRPPIVYHADDKIYSVGGDVVDNNNNARKSYLVNEPVKYWKKTKASGVRLSHYRKQPAGEDDNADSNPQYAYAYGVHDPETGDSKQVHENRDGDRVSGQYSFIDANGKRRTVVYTADKHSGFKAIHSIE